MLRRRISSITSRMFSSSSLRAQVLRIGYVPEHFSTPINFAQKYYGLDAELIPFPSGTGHMIQSLKSDEIDVGIGLTEGWVAGIGKAIMEKQPELPYKIVGTYVETPLRWAISTGAKRDIKEANLRGKKIGVSRIGSGSYVMGYVLADSHGWLAEATKPFEPIVLNTFAKLREAVNSGEADFFMWEYFTSKKYYDNGEIKYIGDIYTPWSSWKIVTRNTKDQRIGPMNDALNKGLRHFEENKDEAVDYISTELDYSAEDARVWLQTVRFPKDVTGVDLEVVQKTVEHLRHAGVLEDIIDSEAMIGTMRKS